MLLDERVRSTGVVEGVNTRAAGDGVVAGAAIEDVGKRRSNEPVGADATVERDGDPVDRHSGGIEGIVAESADDVERVGHVDGAAVGCPVRRHVRRATAGIEERDHRAASHGDEHVIASRRHVDAIVVAGVIAKRVDLTTVDGDRVDRAVVADVRDIDLSGGKLEVRHRRLDRPRVRAGGQGHAERRA